MATTWPPDSIIIVGAGVLGLSTALALSRRYSGKITLVEASPTIPNPHGASVDTSRIIRADYSKSVYANLAAAAVKQWQTTEWGHDGRYSRNGLVFVSSGNDHAAEYMKRSYENVKTLDDANSGAEYLPTPADVERVLPGYRISENYAGGYINWASGWGDAEASVRYAKKLVDDTGRIEIIHGIVTRLISTTPEPSGKTKITGIELSDGKILTADLTVLTTGAWTGQLVDLRGYADASGHILAYIKITDEEQARLGNMPTYLNFSSGLFIIPPRNNLLKVARHSHGYHNPKTIRNPTRANGGGGGGGGNDSGDTIQTSLPDELETPIPREGESALRALLREILPEFADRPFVMTRLCWYSDTLTGDWIISHHPDYQQGSLFIATGDSGHAFKFFPVIGDKIVDALEGKLDPELKELWSWPERPVVDGDGKISPVFTGDGSRSGPRGLILKEELGKGSGVGKL